jgi:hypothetical protein
MPTIAHHKRMLADEEYRRAEAMSQPARRSDIAEVASLLREIRDELRALRREREDVG